MMVGCIGILLEKKKNPYESLSEILHVGFQQNKHKSDDFGQE